jgi:TM2 domain-containing membrane protein YozV
MKTRFTYSMLIFSAFIMVLSSCSVEKRTHLSGYHIDWKNKNENAANRVKQEKIDAIVSQEVAVATIETEVAPEEATEVTASVNAAEIALVAPIAKLAKKAVSKSVAVNTAEVNTSNVSLTEEKQAVKPLKIEKKAAAPKPLERIRNQIIAAVLAFFLGWLGIHRFYLGYTGAGIVQLLLFILGIPLMLIFIGYLMILAAWIWVLIDFIRILLGDLKPKGGSYSNKI